MDDFDRDGWERRWSQVLREHGEMVARRPPNARLTELAARLTPGRALDAGCGHGAEAMWLAGHGWQVTAVDFSQAALDHAAATARDLGVADRITWVQGDLGAWTPGEGAYDLVTCLYVHVAGSVPAMVARLASGVAPGGTLLLVGHQPVDPETGLPTPAAGQVQVTVAGAREALDRPGWEVLTADEQRRPDGGGVDAVIQAVRR